MSNKDIIAPQGEFILFQNVDGDVRIECRFIDDSAFYLL